ncbi:hypothetical protein BOX15_Mlig007761g2 [Macrostomum lignano]|uniref:RGS domain-containing protein n=1 Tax=Macrostomum lignano TaxID=282301 RepID=A0A267GI58_9PLAT|nr:hypothetical protein BOX15_Mlig007761g2 [Macrostomum lignano]
MSVARLPQSFSLDARNLCRGTSRLERGFADVYAEGSGGGGSGGGGGGGTCRELLFQFQRFLQRRGQRHLLQFCFDADSFKAACGSRCSAANTGLTALAESGGPSETSVADNPSSRVAERLRKLIESDAVSLYKAYLAPEANPKLPIDDAIKVQIVEAMCSDNESHCIQPNTFDAARQAVYSLLADQLYNEFLSSPILAEYQLDFLSNRLGELNISDIVYCSSLVFNFMEYMDSLGASRFLQFLFDVRNFESNSASPEAATAASDEDALCLYDRYFSLQATYPLGFDDQFRVEVEIALCPSEPGAGVRLDCFERAKQLVLQYLQAAYLPSYLSSNMLSNHIASLTYLVDTAYLRSAKEQQQQQQQVQSNNYQQQFHRHSSTSTAATTSSTVGSVHSEPVTNADYQRSIVNFGRVDHLGRFHSDLHPIDGRKYGGGGGAAAAALSLLVEF